MDVQKKTNINILIVDDKVENLIALEAMLEAPHRTFIRANSGNEALKFAIKREDIGLVILDVQMPEMDGFEVARILQSNARTKNIAIIFVTAINKEEYYVIKGFEDGAVDYLAKPLDVNIARAKVNVFERLYFYQESLRQALSEKKIINDQLERFMYVVAHDLKSPLSGLISMLALLQYELDDAGASTKEYLALCETSALRLSKMISSILSYSKEDSFTNLDESVDLNVLLSDLRTALMLPANVDLTIKGALPVLFTNQMKLYQVFQNLVTNAIKHADKAVIKVEVGLAEEDEDFYTFYVKDNGKGIEKKDFAGIFNLFQTLDNPNDAAKENTGVGLNLVKLFVEKQGGTITLHSDLNIGSTFFFKWRKY